MSRKLQDRLNSFFWINQPPVFEWHDDRLEVVTEPQTDLWQRTYYGFCAANAPSFVTELKVDFSFSVKADFSDSHFMYDQCGLLLFLDSENWIKASVEYENSEFSRLGSVVTNLGYSDWATTDIPAHVNEMWFRVSRRGQDFYLENSDDGISYIQMRMLHLHQSAEILNVGVYACSPLNSSFRAKFSEFTITECQWPEFNTNLNNLNNECI